MAANERNKKEDHKEMIDKIKETKESLIEQRNELRTLKRQHRLRMKIMRVGPNKFESFAEQELAWRRAEMEFIQALIDERRAGLNGDI